MDVACQLKIPPSMGRTFETRTGIAVYTLNVVVQAKHSLGSVRVDFRDNLGNGAPDHLHKKEDMNSVFIPTFLRASLPAATFIPVHTSAESVMVDATSIRFCGTPPSCKQHPSPSSPEITFQSPVNSCLPPSKGLLDRAGTPDHDLLSDNRR